MQKQGKEWAVGTGHHEFALRQWCYGLRASGAFERIWEANEQDFSKVNLQLVHFAKYTLGPQTFS